MELSLGLLVLKRNDLVTNLDLVESFGSDLRGGVVSLLMLVVWDLEGPYCLLSAGFHGCCFYAFRKLAMVHSLQLHVFGID